MRLESVPSARTDHAESARLSRPVYTDFSAAYTKPAKLRIVAALICMQICMQSRLLANALACVTRMVTSALSSVVALLATVAFSATTQAQSFDVRDFRDTTGFVHVNLGTVGTSVNLTPLSPRPGAGAIWRRERVDVSQTWSSVIQFVIADTGGAADPSDKGGADGLAFVIQLEGPERVGATGYNLGYGAIAGGIAFEVDTWDDSDEMSWRASNATEDVADHVAIHSNGRGLLSAVPKYSIVHESRALGIDVSDGLPHTLAVRYTPGMLRVYVDDCATPAISMVIWLDQLLGEPTAYIGITASTQAAWQRHIITSWCFTATGVDCGCANFCDTIYVDRVVYRDSIVYRDTGRVVTVYRDTGSVRIDTVTRWRDSIRTVYRDTGSVRVEYRDTGSHTVVYRDTGSVRIDSVPYPVHHYDTTRVIEYRDTCLPDTVPALTSLDTICGGHGRLMEMSLFHSQIDKVAPNPADASVAIEFQVGDAGAWGLYIYDARGSLRIVIAEKWLEPGTYRATTETHQLPIGSYRVALRRGRREVFSAHLMIQR